MILSRSMLVLFVAAAVPPSPAESQRPSPAGVVRHEPSAPFAIDAKKAAFTDSVPHDGRAAKGATIGAILGGVSGIAFGASLPIGCTPVIEGGDPNCSVTRAHVQWGMFYGVLGAGAGALVGGAVGKLLQWL